ncbi:hypothetical protein EDB81DRAFT_412906 [Dactylonectria macrodidyma]|uniref:Uncharacterized protein n=1 Tax=Dactylonectria macrodidyma TaxID=307937 RepID=A0A9P9FB23_9HYPO|nr:hypothetical protein EDB81DRAFT_412906 [Dactylonectria macrodidyma]
MDISSKWEAHWRNNNGQGVSDTDMLHKLQGSKNLPYRSNKRLNTAGFSFGLGYRHDENGQCFKTRTPCGGEEPALDSRIRRHIPLVSPAYIPDLDPKNPSLVRGQAEFEEMPSLLPSLPFPPLPPPPSLGGRPSAIAAQSPSKEPRSDKGDFIHPWFPRLEIKPIFQGQLVVADNKRLSSRRSLDITVAATNYIRMNNAQFPNTDANQPNRENRQALIARHRIAI